MVKGSALINMVEYVEKKKGINGLEILHNEVNKENLIIPQLKNINKSDEFSARYFERMLNASLKSLGSSEETIHDFGYSYGTENGLGFGSKMLKLESFKKVLDYITASVQKNMPLFKVRSEDLSETTYVLKISNLSSKEQSIFVSGYIDSLISNISKKIQKKEEDVKSEKVITLRFIQNI